MTQKEAVMKRLTAEELQKLQAVWDSNVNERWNHEAAVSLGCIARPVLPALLAMASRLVEVESALEMLERNSGRERGFWLPENRLPSHIGNLPAWCRIGNLARVQGGLGDWRVIANFDTLHEWLTFEDDPNTEWSWDEVEPQDLPADPTPTEAPARFRVGQLCRKNYEVHPPETGLVRIVALETIDGDACARFTYVGSPPLFSVEGRDRLVDLTPVDEPADPAPPKPGGEVLTVERMVKALERLVNQGGIIRPDSPGSWFGKLAEELVVSMPGGKTSTGRRGRR